MKDDKRASDWKARVAQWKASGLRQSEFARQHGLSAHQLGYWIGRDRQAAATPAPVLLPVQIQSTDQPEPVASGAKLSSPRGWTIHLPAPLSAKALSELIRVLP
jgi:hypothetical protein